MSGIFDEFGGSLTADVLSFNPDAIPEPDTLVIRMTRGERHIADELREQFGGFKRVVIDVDGERHEFSADSLILVLEDYEDAQGMNNHMKLFGTPERAAETAWRLLMCDITTRCGECPMREGCNISTDADCDDGVAALLEWLRGASE